MFNPELFDYISYHREFSRAFYKALALLQDEPDEFILFIVTVSRAGKRALLGEIRKALEAKGHVTAYFKAPPKTTSQFTFTPYLEECLTALGDPFSPTKLNKQSPRHSFLMELMRRKLIDRKVQYLFVDEANLFVMTRSEAQTEENLEFLKSLANIEGTTHVFAGTEKLYKFLGGDDQLMNRGEQISIRAYKMDDEEDRSEFSTCLREFEACLKIPLSKKLHDDPEVFHSETLGCIGALKELLLKAEKVAHAGGKRVIDEDVLSAVKVNDPERKREKAIQVVDNYFEARSPAEGQEEVSGTSDKQPRGKKSAKKNGKPFKSKPRRDPVGRKS